LRSSRTVFARKVLLEAQDVFDLGAAPTIDALVVVAEQQTLRALAISRSTDIAGVGS